MCACQVIQAEKVHKLTDSPNFSPRSAATLSETDIADILLGWVQIMLHTAPRAASVSDSNMYWGSCVVLPQPVSPETTTTCKFSFMIPLNINYHSANKHIET